TFLDEAVENVVERPRRQRLAAALLSLAHGITALRELAELDLGDLARDLCGNSLAADRQPFAPTVFRVAQAVGHAARREAADDEACQLIVGDELARLQLVDGALCDGCFHGGSSTYGRGMYRPCTAWDDSTR